MLVISVTDGNLLSSDPARETFLEARANTLVEKGSAMITTVSSSPKKEHENPRLGSVGLRFRSILAATDCSPASEVAVKLAARLAKESHARLYVLHSILPELYAVDMHGSVPELALMDLQNAREDLHKYVGHIPDLRTVKHQEMVFLGFPGDAIQSAGESNGIDLLVLGSHGRHGLAKLTIGSVAEWAIRRLNYPVLVAGPTCDKSLRPIRSILLATDLSQQASRSAQYASSMAQDYNARLTVMNVLPQVSTSDEQNQAQLRTKEKLQQLVPSDCGERCTLKFEVKTGDIAPAILHSAQVNKANLIVLGAKHRAPLADHMPRTKLSAIIRGSHCPVLVVPTHSS
jgi:nucleotide-binding universal stress UspA family protein